MKILVIDRCPMMRLGIATLLGAQDDMWIVGVTSDIDRALAVALEKEPDIVVLGLIIEGHRCGMELCRMIKSRPDPPSIVVYTENRAEEELFSYRMSGADSYVHKDEEPGRLLEAIRETHTGNQVWYIGDAKTSHPDNRDVIERSSLTPRERQVFALLLKRYTNSHIADELGISLQTAKNHASNVLRKIGVSRRTDLPWR